MLFVVIWLLEGLIMLLSFGEAYVGIESIGGARIAGAGSRYAF